MINKDSGSRNSLSKGTRGLQDIELLRLLVVEWDATARDQLLRGAGETGFEATACSTPDEARSLLEGADFHALVFDTQLYGESAGEFLAWLDSLGERKPYVIAIADEEGAGEAGDWLKRGADDFLVKPLAPGALKIRLAVMERRLAEDVEREKSLASMKRSHARFENLFLESPDAVLVLKDRQGKVIGVNRAVSSILGYDGKALLGKYMSLVFPDIFGRDGLASRGDVLSGATVLHAIPYRRPDGGRRYLDIVMSAVPWDRGYALMMVCRDVSGREGDEGGRIQSSKDEALARLASGMAGEFGDLLTSIGGNLSLLETAPFLTDESRETIERAQAACERGRELTVEVAALGGGGRAARRARVELPRLVEKSVQFALFDFENVRPVFRVADDLSEVAGDEGELRRLADEVASNAARAMAGAGGQLQVELSDISIGASSDLPLAEGDYVKVVFRDTGPGISEEELRQIFDPYFSGDGSGRGCGLSRAAVICRRHGGHIEAHSRPGEGACFEIYLPANPGESVAGGADGAVDTKSRTAGLRVLVLDDEPQILRVVERALGSSGHEVFCVENGEEALKAYQKAEDFGRPFDVLLFDLDIRGGMGGQETLARIRAENPGVRAIVTTGYVDDTVLENYLEHGFCGVLCKPFRIEHLAAAVERLGRGSGGE